MIKRAIIVFFTMCLTTVSQQANAGDKSLSIYTPFTFGSSSIATKDDTTIVKGSNSDGRFGVGVNVGFQKNAGAFLEKVAVGDSSKNIYLTGIKFFTDDALMSPPESAGSQEENSQRAKGFKAIGQFVKASYIFGLARMTQDEKKTELDIAGKELVTYDRRTGYNMAIGAELFTMKSSNLHLVPLRFIITVGQSGTSAFVSSEIGVSLFDL
jgi:hypothetical protein